MLKLFSREIISQIDAETILSGTSSRNLIFRAANAYVKWMESFTSQREEVNILCGNGNNGADGLLVSEILHQRGYQVNIILVGIHDKRSDENRYFLDRIKRIETISSIVLQDKSDFDQIPVDGILIDALFGNGINRALDGLYSDLILFCNDHFNTIYALDIPSGLLAQGPQLNAVMKCSKTFAFEFPKLSFFAPENSCYVGDWSYGSIGLSKDAIQSAKSNTFLIELSDIQSQLVKRDQFVHKGQNGRVLLIGDLGKMSGAFTIMSKACVQMGAGLTYGFSISQKQNQWSSIPQEVIMLNSIEDIVKDMNVIAIGPGLGLANSAEEQLDKLLSQDNVRLVLDADAINILGRKQWLNRIPEGTILTPHIKEFRNLVGASKSHDQRIEAQRSLSIDRSVYIILKGRYSSISTPTGKIYYNQTGNPALAKGGSGDALTGIISALLAQGYTQEDSCIIGTFIHGLTADLYIKESHEMAMNSSDIIRLIPNALQYVTA